MTVTAGPHEAVPYQYLDRLISLATGEAFLAQVREAKARYFRATGEVFEDDPFFEQRMNGFLEYYLFDWPAGPGGKSTTALIIERGKEKLPPDDLVAFAGFERNVHSVFEFKKKKGDTVTCLNLFDDEKYQVHERRTLAGLEKGDVFESRLLPFGDRLYFSNAFVFHPRSVRKFVLGLLKEARKSVGDPAPAVQRLAYLRLKFDRMKRVDVAKVYSRETLAQIERELGAVPPTRLGGGTREA